MYDRLLTFYNKNPKNHKKNIFDWLADALIVPKNEI